MNNPTISPLIYYLLKSQRSIIEL